MCGPARFTCSTLCTVVDGTWVSVEGNPLANNNGVAGSRTLCAKGQAAPHIVKAAARIAYPLRRVAGACKVVEACDEIANVQEAEASGTFERITWDEAVADFADVLTRQKTAFGAESFGILSPQFFPVLAQMGRRFLNVHGSPNYLHSGICFTQRVFSRLVTIGGASHFAPASVAPAQMDKTKLLVVWGANDENAAVNQGGPRARLANQARGMQVIDIRPTLEALGSKADVWVPLRPGTDCALALAVLHVIIGEGLYDRAFVDEWCYGFDELAAHVKAYAPEWAAEVTGVPADVIRRIARMMGSEHPMAIHIGNGVGDQQSDGHWAVACISLIVALTGNLDVPGGGGAEVAGLPPVVKLGRIDSLADRLAPDDCEVEQGWMPGVARLSAPETPRWFQTMRTQGGGPTGAYFKALMDVLADKPGHLRCVFAQSTNPLSATRRPDMVARALCKLDYFVVMDTEWNPSCALADLVLPACTGYETSHQIAVRNRVDGTWVGINQQVVEPFGEARSDWQLYLDLGVAMGYGADFWNGDMDACLREQLEGTGVTLEQLRAAPQGVLVPREGAVRADAEAGAAERAGAEAGAGAANARAEASAVGANARPAASCTISGDAVKADAEAGAVGAMGAAPAAREQAACRRYDKLFAALPHGKVACANELLGGMPSADGTRKLARLPEYRGPAESLAGTPELAREYPYVFSDVHAYGLCQHGYYADVPLLREHQPYPWMLMNPQSAAREGLRDGGWARVVSPHGAARFVVREFAGIAPDVLMVRRGWWQACPELGVPGYSVFGEGSEPNVLYSVDPAYFDPFHSSMGKQTLVRVERVEDAEPVPPSSASRRAHDREALAHAASRGAFAFDPWLCIGCRACEVACKQRAGEGGTRGTRRVVECVEGEFPQVKREFFSIASRLCAEEPCAQGQPPCVVACPMSALRLA